MNATRLSNHLAIVMTIASTRLPAADGTEPDIPPPAKILTTLRPDHPRVMARPETWDGIQFLVAKGGLPAKLYAEVKRSADQMLAAPVSKYEKPDGRRLLSVSRQVLDRVRTLALVSRLDGDPRYANRTWQELEAAAGFPDWNPSHFLDTAEMTHAFALGYDWLYDRWTEEQRRLLRGAIVAKGLREGLKVYDSSKGWPRNENNWNQVCNGGLISGALAIADAEPQLAARIVSEAVQSVSLAMKHYAPDGGGTEGVTYWDYGSRYNIVLLSSLQTALGTDFGLAQVGAFGQSGYYQIYLCGANRVAFDFADCGRSRVSEAQHFWLARQYEMPAYSWFRLSALEGGQERGGVLDLLWFDDRGRTLDFKALPLDRHFRGAECAALRTSWEPDAMIVGIQASDSMNLGGHRHLDLGSFIVDAQGERWIMDSGVEHETYMTHRNKTPRPAYYRVRAEGHNVPVLNPDKGPDQNPRAVAKIVRFESTPQQAVAVVDLSQAYQSAANRVVRTFALPDRKRLVVTDELSARQPAELWWFLHTEARVTLSNQGRVATLSRDGKSFTVRLQEPAGAAFEVLDCQPLPSSPNPEPQADNRGRRKLAIHLRNVESTRIQVSLTP
ncbi:MAG: heparinase II/III family protein [Verrucomicrobia bacterium]|nr:heparinase II/III family protein [Verrucomicrobiota bacterium]